MASIGKTLIKVLLFVIGAIFFAPLIASSHDTGALITGRVRRSPVHQYITQQAGQVLSNLPSEMKDHLRRPLRSRVDALCLADYDPGYDDIVTGSADEDMEWFPYMPLYCGPVVGPRYTNGFMDHFWDPDEPNFGGAAAYGKGFNDPNVYDGYQFASAYNKAQEFWERKVICYYTGRGKYGDSCPVDKDQAYYWLGRVAHLLEDVAVPAHVHNARHDPLGWLITFGEKDPFESYVGSVYSRFRGFKYTGSEYRHEDLPCTPLQGPYTCASLKNNFDWTSIHPNPTDLFKLFWFTAQKTQYFATGGNILAHPGDIGAYRKLDESGAQFQPSLWEVEGITPIEIPDDVPTHLREMAEALAPHAMRAVAGLYRLFWIETHGYWSMYGHDAQHTWSSPLKGPISGELKWVEPFSDPDGRYFRGMAIGRDGTIFALSERIGYPDAMLYALNPDRSLKWQYPLSSYLDWQPSPAVGPDGTVYIGAGGKLYAFLPDGSPRWDPVDLGLGDVPVSAPIIGTDGLVYVVLQAGGGDRKIVAVDPAGSTPAERIKWVYRPPADLNGQTFGPLTIGHDGTIYASFLRQGGTGFEFELAAIAPMSPSGSIKWRFGIPGAILSQPSVDSRGDLYFGASNGNLYALRPNGRIRWVKPFGWDVYSSTVAIDPDKRILYVGSSDGLYAIDSRTGLLNPGWWNPYAYPGITSLALSGNGILYFVSAGLLFAVRAADQSELFASDLSGLGHAMPTAISMGLNDTVYAGDYGSVYAVGPDLSPPDTTITSGPTGTISANTVTFSWTGSDDLTPTVGLVYAWYLQPVQSTYSSFSATTSRSYANLPDGTYTFFVKARDQAGNEDPAPASQSFTVQAGGGGGGWTEVPPE